MSESEPHIVKKQSIALKLEPGTYFYCRCGLSQDQPFCDGAHKNTEFRPKKFIIDTPQQAQICLCKHTKSAPYCDGTHRKI